MLDFIAALVSTIIGLAVVDFNIAGWRDLAVFSSVFVVLFYPALLMLEDMF